MNRIMKRKANALSLCLAAALLLGLSQCKKQETPITPPTPEETEEGIHITLDVEDGSRHVVIPGTNTAVVNYSFGDKIYVGDGSKYIGTLTNTGSTGGTSSHFEGTILSPSSETLHFYFVGGLETGTLTKGSTTTFNVDISDQSSNLPVLSYGNAPYAKDATSYTCMLMNQCGLVKVEFAVATSEVVSLSASPSGQDFLTHANINFDLNDNSAIVPTADPTGNPCSINLYSQNGRKKWAILLPQTLPNGTESVQAIVKIGTEGTSTYNVKVPEITENIYTSIINEEYVPAVNLIYNCGPVFSVSDDKFVSFSKGNLQYQPSSSIPTWRFADKQWHYVGGTNSENPQGSGTIEGSDNAKILDEGYTGWMDLFGWGTWGSNGNPLNISTDLEDYTWSEFTETLDGHNDWRTLSYDEWNYLLDERQSSYYAMVKCAWAKVNGVYGIVLLPDNWDKTIIVSNINGGSHNVYYGAQFFDDDDLIFTYDGEDWRVMEKAGAVFLPAAGNRTVTIKTTTEGEPPTTTTDTLINVYVPGEKGYYWTSTTDSHNYVEFDNTGVTTNYTTDNYTFGCSVRLVRDIE